MPYFSVIIPAHDAARYLGQTLPALRKSSWSDYEVAVVDDGSSDGTAEIATGLGCRVIRTEGKRGPGAARNAGAQAASGEILVFLDADCVPHPDTLELIRKSFEENRDLAAVFGSYDDQPRDPSLVSSFKNLMHHYVHHSGNQNASTFWTGCGAVRADVFRKVGPFLPTTLTCVEDIEYGHRLNDAGYRILLNPKIQVQHLKRWTLGGLVRTDMLVRGIPWTVMMLRRGRRDTDLNLKPAQKLAAACACLILPSLALTWWGIARSEPLAAIYGGTAFFFLMTCVLGLNLPFYRMLWQKRGRLFAIGCIPIHLFYYHYSVLSFFIGFALYLALELRSRLR